MGFNTLINMVLGQLLREREAQITKSSIMEREGKEEEEEK